MNPAVTVLVVEDEPHIRQFIEDVLLNEGCKVCCAENGQRALIEAGSRRPDILILDLGLPDMDGLEVIKAFRTWSQAPVLILSARSDEQDKVAALDCGADDYLTKPFGVAELLARLRALLRRRFQAQDSGPDVHFGDVHVDLARRTVSRAGDAVHLTPIEYRLLSVLLAQPDKVLTHRSLMREVWGPNHSESGHYLRIYMSHLRQKLELDPTQPQHFLTETGVGYRFCL